MTYHAHAFVDGASVEVAAELLNCPLPAPSLLSDRVLQRACHSIGNERVVLRRTTYYDGCPDDEQAATEARRAYWTAIERLSDTALGFGYLRGRKAGGPRQKAVDTLIAVDMLVGAFTQLFDVALLIAADADFVPVVGEVKRRGITVIVAGHPKRVSDELIRAADRFLPFETELDWYFKPMSVNGSDVRPADLRAPPPNQDNSGAKTA